MSSLPSTPGLPVRRSRSGGESIPESLSFEVLTQEAGIQQGAEQNAWYASDQPTGVDPYGSTRQQRNGCSEGDGFAQGESYGPEEFTAETGLIHTDENNEEEHDHDVEYENGRHLLEVLLTKEEKQKQERHRLSVFITQLKAELFEGEHLVAFPDDYDRIVQKLILEKRSQYKCLDGWLGPRKFADLPIHALNISLPQTHEDTKISHGLKTIRRLDEELHDKTLDAYIVDRETFPDKWDMKDRMRMKLQRKELDGALKRERRRRQRAARLQRLLHATRNHSSITQMMTQLHKGPYARYYCLSPEEEDIVNSVLRRTEEELERNAFECDVCEDDDEQSSSRMSEIDAQLQCFATSETDTMWRSIDAPQNGSFMNGSSRTAFSNSRFQSCSSRMSAGHQEQSEDSLNISLRQDYLREAREEKELNNRMETLDKQLRDLRTSELNIGMEADKLAELIDQCKWQLEVEKVGIADVGSLDIHEIIRGGGSQCMSPLPSHPLTPVIDTRSNS